MATGTHLLRKQLWVDLDTASDITGIDVGTLILWQQCFRPFLEPEHVKGEPRYTAADIETVHQIKRLIHHGGLTRQGAKRALAWTYKRVA